MPGRMRHFAIARFDRAVPASLRRYEFLNAADAEQGGEILARSAVGVAICRQWVDEDLGLFEPVDLISTMGQMPPLLDDAEAWNWEVGADAA